MIRAEEVIEELPTALMGLPGRWKQVGSERCNLLPAGGLTDSQRMIYEQLRVDQPRPIYDIAETSGLNSGEVLATLFDLETKGLVRATRWKTVQQGVVVSAGVSDPRATICTLRMV